MKRFVQTGVIALLLIILGCVFRTEHKIDAHITLDIRVVEQEVAGVFDYVQGAAKELPAVTAEPGAKPTSWLPRAVDTLFPVQVAYAQEANTSPFVEEIAGSMKKRYPEIAQWKASGNLGENNRGYVELRAPETLTAETKPKVEQLSKEENQDRQALYKEFARLKKLDVPTLEKVGAKDQLKRAKKGEWVQLPPAGEDFDKLKASQLGTLLSENCTPGKWVRIP